MCNEFNGVQNLFTFSQGFVNKFPVGDFYFYTENSLLPADHTVCTDS